MALSVIPRHEGLLGPDDLVDLDRLGKSLDLDLGLDQGDGSDWGSWIAGPSPPPITITNCKYYLDMPYPCMI